MLQKYKRDVYIITALQITKKVTSMSVGQTSSGEETAKTCPWAPWVLNPEHREMIKIRVHFIYDSNILFMFWKHDTKRI